MGYILGVPTVIRSDGFAVRILLPPREHGPPHVHVVKGGSEAVIRLGPRGRPVELLEVYGMKTKDVLKAVRLVEASKDHLLAIWEEIHGE